MILVTQQQYEVHPHSKNRLRVHKNRKIKKKISIMPNVAAYVRVLFSEVTIFI